MPERITNETLKARERNVNRRLDGTDRAIFVQGRNGYTALDELRRHNGATVRTLTTGTKREVASFLHAMMVGIDLSRPEE